MYRIEKQHQVDEHTIVTFIRLCTALIVCGVLPVRVVYIAAREVEQSARHWGCIVNFLHSLDSFALLQAVRRIFPTDPSLALNEHHRLHHLRAGVRARIV